MADGRAEVWGDVCEAVKESRLDRNADSGVNRSLLCVISFEFRPLGSSAH